MINNNKKNFKNRLTDKTVFLKMMLAFIFWASSITGFAQQGINITGTVSDTSDPLTGVNVVVKGTGIGIVTDINGKYEINVPNKNSVLVFSFLGYVTKEISVGNNRVIDVKLAEDVQAIDEVVVVGYGAQKKESLVAAVTQATGEDLRRASSGSDLTTSLSSQLPGVISLSSSGEPGGIATGESATNIYIRGQNTWNASSPLILVDGVERPLFGLDVNEVESISVLKDASATAVFGVKGANGVILVTTKRGADGKTKLSLNYTATGQMLSKVPETLDSYAAMMAKNEIIEREVSLRPASWDNYIPYEIIQHYKKPQSELDSYYFPNINWRDQMFKNMGLMHRINLNIQGGNKLIKYFGSLAYIHEGDMMKHYTNNKGYDPSYAADRLNFRSNIDFNITSTTKFSANLYGLYSQKNTNYNNNGSTSSADEWMWRAVYGLAPNLFPAQYPDGTWGAYAEGGNNTVNPAAAFANLGVRKTRTVQMMSDFKLNQDLKFITQGLSALLSISFDDSVQSEGGIWDANNHVRPGEEASNVPYTQIYPIQYILHPDDPSKYLYKLPVSTGDYDWYVRPWTINQEDFNLGVNYNWRSTYPLSRRLNYLAQLNYSRLFGLHNVGALGVFKREEYSQGAEFKHYREDWVFRLSYDYDQRYMLEFNGAYNGSEKFGPAYRFAFFPSFALAYYLSNEKFFKVNWIDRLKLRYSIGKVGDDRAGGRYLYDQMYSYGGNARLNWATNEVDSYTFYKIANIANPYARWEQSWKTNYALEYGMLKNLVSLNFDYFTEDNNDILIDGSGRSIPPYFGFTPPPANLGHMKVKGFELELGINKTIQHVSLWTKFTMTHAKNKVIYRDDPKLAADYMKSQGYPLNQNKRVLNTGYFYNNWDDVWASAPTETNDLQKLPGYYDLIDYDGNGVISNTFDAAPVGYAEVPQNTGSLSFGAGYKGLNFSIQFFGANNANRWIPWTNYANDTDILWSHVADYWSKDNPNATSFLPRWKTQAQNIGHYYLYDASYVRLQNTELSYTLKSAWAKKANLNNVKIYLNGNNLVFWSKLPDDRETTNSRGSATNGAYPNLKRINLGIDIQF